MINKLLTFIFKADSVLSTICLILFLVGQKTFVLIPLTLIAFIYIYELSFGITFLRQSKSWIQFLKRKEFKLINLSNATGLPALILITLIINSNSFLAKIATYILLIFILSFNLYELIFTYKNGHKFL